MGTVVVLTADATMALINEAVDGGVIDENGDLILQKTGGGVVNLGNVKSHNQLDGLSADDHPQYALADGSRGSFATVAQGNKADNARPNSQAQVNLTGGDVNGYLEKVVVIHDGTDSSAWANRTEYWFRDTGGVPDRRVTYINEVGELRVIPARENTVGLRVFAKEFPDRPTNPRSTTIPVVELMDDRNTRTSLRGWLGDGTETRNGIKMSDVLVLGPTDPVPVGTPANTVILRKS